SDGAVASSRSNSTWSASSVTALACIRALLAGTDKHDRCGFNSRLTGCLISFESDAPTDHHDGGTRIVQHAPEHHFGLHRAHMLSAMIVRGAHRSRATAPRH